MASSTRAFFSFSSVGGVGYDDARLGRFFLLDALDQNSVVQRSHFHGCCLLIEIHVLGFEIQSGDLPGVSSWSSDN